MGNTITYDYSGATVLVTGGSNGIGLAIARAYQAAGASVIITGRQARAADYPHDLDGLRHRVRGAHHRADVACDAFE